MSDDYRAQADALDGRIRTAIADYALGDAAFDALACDIFAHQFRWNAPYAAYARSLGLAPAASAYAQEAIRVHGAGRGTWLAARRLSRCHPFHPGGLDPVPPGRQEQEASADDDSGAEQAAGQIARELTH